MIVVEAGHPLDPQPKALLEQSHALMTSLFPRDACHFLDFDKLTAPHIRFLIAREGDVAAGTGALAVLDGYGEVKSMFTDPNARGNGVAAAILRALGDLACPGRLRRGEIHVHRPECTRKRGRGGDLACPWRSCVPWTATAR